MSERKVAPEFSIAARGWGRFARGDRAGMLSALEILRTSRDENGDELPFFEALFLCFGVEERIDAPAVPSPDAVGPVWDDLQEAVLEGYVSSDPPSEVALRAAQPDWDIEDAMVSRRNLARWVEAIGITPFPAPLVQYLPPSRPQAVGERIPLPRLNVEPDATGARIPMPKLAVEKAPPSPEEEVVTEAAERRANYTDPDQEASKAFIRRRYLELAGKVATKHDLERLWKALFEQVPNKGRPRNRN